jgi:hypothetical protein
MFTEEVTEDRATVVKGQVIRQQVNVACKQRLGVVLVLDAVLTDLVDFTEMLLCRRHVVVLVCVSHRSLPRNSTWTAPRT